MSAIESIIEIRYSDTNQQKYAEELRKAVFSSNLHDAAKEKTLSNGYDIHFNTREKAKNALTKTKTYLKNKKLWDNDKNNCKSDFLKGKGIVAWDIYYYGATAVLNLKDADDINEELL